MHQRHNTCGGQDEAASTLLAPRRSEMTSYFDALDYLFYFLINILKVKSKQFLNFLALLSFYLGQL